MDKVGFRKALNRQANMGSLREARGDLEGAVEIYGRSLETIAPLVREHPDSVEWIGELAESHNLLGLAYRKQGRYRESLEEHQEELELKDRILEMAPEHAYWRLRNAIAHTFTGRLQLLTGDLEDALVSYRRATSALDSMVALDPSNAEWHREAASTYRGLGSTLAAQGRNDDAIEAFAEARRHLEPVLRADSTSFDYRPVLGTIEAARASALLARGEPGEALSAADEAEKLLGDASPTDLDFAAERIANDLTRGAALEASGREEEALVVRERALAQAEELRDRGGVQFRPLLAESYLSLSRIEEARGILSELWEQGYRESELVVLARERGLGP